MKKVLLITAILFICLFSIFFFTSNVFAAPPDAYWVNNSGNWSEADSHWANVSGGVPWSTNLPDATTNTHFDLNSFNISSYVTIDSTANCRDINWSTSTNTPILNRTTKQLRVYGNVTFISDMQITSTATEYLYLRGVGKTITTNGLVVNTQIQMLDATASYVLQDNLNMSTYLLSFVGGTLDTNGKDVILSSLSSTGATARVLKLGASHIFCTSWIYTGSGFTFYSNTSVINCSGSLTGGNLDFYTVNLVGAASTVSGNNSCNQFNLASNVTQTITFTDLTRTNASSFSLSGDATHTHTIKGSSTNGYTLNLTSGGTVSSDYIALTYCNGSPIHTFCYGSHSTIGTGVTNWYPCTCYLTAVGNPVAGGTPSFTGSSPFAFNSIVPIFANPNSGYLFSNWTPTTNITNPALANTTIGMWGNQSITANYLIKVMYPPTNMVITNVSSMCINSSWVIGTNASSTLTIICEDTAYVGCGVPNTSNLSAGCYVLYNGSGATLNTNYCGIDTNWHDYYITAWGYDGAVFSVNCSTISIGGDKMTDMIFFVVIVGLATILLLIGVVKKFRWITVASAIPWALAAYFSWQEYNADGSMLWEMFALFGLVMFIVAGAMSIGAGGGDGEDSTGQEVQPRYIQNRNKLSSRLGDK